MNFSINYKLLLTFFVATVAVVGAMWLLINWSFDRGFIQYVNTSYEESHKRMVDLLTEEFQTSGSWNSLLQDDGRRRWWEYGFNSYSRPQNQTQQDRIEGDEPRSTSLEGGSESNSATGDNASSEQTRNQRSHRDSRLILLDANKNLLIGRINNIDDMELKPIVANGKIVGYLGAGPSRRLRDNYDLRFSEEQGRAFTFIALATIFIATILILPLSRNLVKPINKLADATRDLASGKYDVRIPIKSNDEIGQLSRDFNSLAKTLEQNENTRRQWIADISHELRTPLTVMRGELESIQDGIRKMSPDRINALHKEVMNLNRLINDLYELSLSDIGALSYQKRVINLDEVINASIEMMIEEFREKNIKVTLQKDNRSKFRIFADPDRLQQLFTNLLTNSLRYTDNGGELIVELKKLHNRVILDFQDSAPGVEDEDLPRLFERLYRVDSSRSRQTGGAGLGLSICKNIVEAHDGKITARKSSMNGLWINIEFPGGA